MNDYSAQKIVDTLVKIEFQLNRLAKSFERQQRIQEEMLGGFSHTTKAGIHFGDSTN
jgi:hypothetical protein